jgi:serine phosphatase RsbU (regulator of sigma subunit)
MRLQVLAQSVVAAVAAYVIAGGIEAAVIQRLQPSELELAWLSDLILAVAFGAAVYLWRNLLATRRELTARQRADLVLQSQLAVAAEIQQRLLPQLPAPSRGFEFAATLASAGKIGGDFYDFVEPTPGIVVTLVADVSGKGIPAAMALGSLRSAFRTLIREHRDPAVIVERLSAALHQDWLGSPYVTCLVAVFDTLERTVTYTNAGHPSGLIIGVGGTTSLSRGGPPAGLMPGARFEQETIALHAGDICLLVTDGVTEALEGQPPLDRQMAPRVGDDSLSAADLCRDVMVRALRGHGPLGVADWEDDRTVVAVKVQAVAQRRASDGRAEKSAGRSDCATLSQGPSRLHARYQPCGNRTYSSSSVGSL